MIMLSLYKYTMFSKIHLFCKKKKTQVGVCSMLLMTVAAAVIWNTIISFKFSSFHTEISWYRRTSLQMCMGIMAVWVHSVRLQCKCTKTVLELQYFMHYVHLRSKCTLEFIKKSHKHFIGFSKQGVHGWLKYIWYMIKHGSAHTY